jgi:glycosyltransferase involved in cell wall biosynthesis
MQATRHITDISRLRIVILISVFARGGAERQAYLLARELRRRSLDVEVWALMHEGEYAADFEAAGIPTKVLGFRYPQNPLQWLRRVWRVMGPLRQGKIDVLLPFTTWPNVIAGLTYKLCGIRLAVWGERSAGGWRVPGLERIAAAQYRRFAANSPGGIKFLVDEMRVPADRISFVPNGIEPPVINEAVNWRAELGLVEGQLLVIKIANLTRAKDHATVLRAWKQVQDAWPEGARPLLALAGLRGDRYEACRQLAAETGLDATVAFLGSIADVSPLIQASDLAVFSSPAEGMPNGVLECMAAGKAVVASDLPGVRYALGSNMEDALVTPGDPDQFAGKLLHLLRSKGRRDEMGVANRARIASEFSVEQMANRYLDVIEMAGAEGRLSVRNGG